MNSIALNTKKAEVIQLIEAADNEEVLDKMLSYGQEVMDPSSIPRPYQTVNGGDSPRYYTVEEVFDELDQNLIDFYGEEVLGMINESRAEWNKKSPWKFDPL